MIFFENLFIYENTFRDFSYKNNEKDHKRLTNVIIGMREFLPLCRG